MSALVDTLVKKPLNSLDRLGEQLAFYIKALAWSGKSVTRYRKEILRLLAEVTLGTGALAVIGGTVGVMGGYVFNVVLQDGTPGSYIASFTALAHLPDLWQGQAKALVFGFIAAVVASYKGMNAGGGPKGVGDAVNQSVVITFMLLFVANFAMTAIYFQLVPPKGA